MAYIRAHDTTARRKGKAVKRYEVVFTEFVRDPMGLPIPVDPAKPSGKKKTRARQESFGTREFGEARRDELNAARQTLGTASLADKRKAGDLPFGYYADGWLKSMDVKVSRGALKETTAAEYRRSLRCYVMDQFGGQAAASISPRHCEDFLADLVGRVAVEVGSRYPVYELPVLSSGIPGACRTDQTSNVVQLFGRRSS